MNEVIVSMNNISKSFPGVKALDHVKFELRSGEVMALLGENGAGKSTLMKILSGVYTRDEGTMEIFGKSYDDLTPKQAQEAGVAIIHQELNMCRHLTVTENMFLGREVKGGLSLNNAKMRKEAKKVLDDLRIDISPDQIVGDLPVSKQQMVEIAKAVQQNAKILIMDEPSAPLTSAEVESMFEVVERLRKEGVSIIYISHRLEEIYRLSDRILVMRDGEYVKTLITKDSEVQELIKLMVGRELTQSYPPRKDCVKKDEVVLELQNVTGNGDTDISLKIHKGEILGLGGLVGAGRTELAEMIFGAVRKKSGKMIFNGKEIDPKSPREAINLGIALVPEDRKRHGAMLGISIKNNINMPIYERNSKLSVINNKQEQEIAEKYKENMAIKTPSLNQLVKNLSGGNQQKVILGRWMAADSELIIFDEPTRGIDVGAKYEIYKLMNDLVENQGKTILMISSEMEELMGMSDRIVVLSEGNMTGELSKDEFTQEVIMTYASAARDK